MPDALATRGRRHRRQPCGSASPGRSAPASRSLIALLCRELATELSLGVITNDIYTDEDARFLRSAGVLDPERIRAVETGACPHTAIRDDVTAEPAGRRGPGARLRAAGRRAGRVRRRQPDGDVLAGAGRRADLRARRGRRRRCRPQGRSRDRPAPTCWSSTRPTSRRTSASTSRRWSPDAEPARDGRPVIALSRTDPASIAELRQWVLDTLAAFRAGSLRPRDPGPMAPHVHAEGVVHSHPGEAVHAHAVGTGDHVH